MTNWLRSRYIMLLAGIDRLRWLLWLQFSNGSSQLQAAYEAVDDSCDCLEGIFNAIADGDLEEAQKLIQISHDRLVEHANTLKGLL